MLFYKYSTRPRHCTKGRDNGNWNDDGNDEDDELEWQWWDEVTAVDADDKDDDDDDADDKDDDAADEWNWELKDPTTRLPVELW